MNYLNKAMLERNANIAPGDSVVACWICHESHYAFADFRSVEETDNAHLKLNGVSIMGQFIRVGRPKNYQPKQTDLNSTTNNNNNIGTYHALIVRQNLLIISKTILFNF
jgi:hypothetical protein